MRTLKTLKTSRCIKRSALVHRRNVTCAEEDTVTLPAPLSLMNEEDVLIAMMLIAMMVLMSRILSLRTTRNLGRNAMIMDASTSRINVNVTTEDLMDLADLLIMVPQTAVAVVVAAVNTMVALPSVP